MKPHGTFSSSFFFPLFIRIILESVGPKTEDLYKKLPCLVCGASASGIHFGAVTCEACKVRRKQYSKRKDSFNEIIFQGFFSSINKRKCS
jgi:hypothetical protein